MEIDKKELSIFEHINLLFKKYEKTVYLIMGVGTAIFSYAKFEAEEKINKVNLKNEFEIRCIKIEQNHTRLNDKVDNIEANFDDLKNRFYYLERKQK